MFLQTNRPFYTRLQSSDNHPSETLEGSEDLGQSQQGPMRSCSQTQTPPPRNNCSLFQNNVFKTVLIFLIILCVFFIVILLIKMIIEFPKTQEAIKFV